MSRVHHSTPPAKSPRRRYSLLLLIIPIAGYVLTPVVANSIEPRILGLPFIVTYTIVVTILTWFFVWMTARGDRYYRRDLPEHIPSDVAFGDDHAIEETSVDGASAEGSEAGR